MIYHYPLLQYRDESETKDMLLVHYPCFLSLLDPPPNLSISLYLEKKTQKCIYHRGACFSILHDFVTHLCVCVWGYILYLSVPVYICGYSSICVCIFVCKMYEAMDVCVILCVYDAMWLYEYVLSAFVHALLHCFCVCVCSPENLAAYQRSAPAVRGSCCFSLACVGSPFSLTQSHKSHRSELSAAASTAAALTHRALIPTQITVSESDRCQCLQCSSRTLHCTAFWGTRA